MAWQLLGILWQCLRFLLGLGRDVDFVVNHASASGSDWVKVLLNYVANPPGWLVVVGLIAGILLIWDGSGWVHQRGGNASAAVERAGVPKSLENGVKPSAARVGVAAWAKVVAGERLELTATTVLQLGAEAGMQLRGPHWIKAIVRPKPHQVD